MTTDQRCSPTADPAAFSITACCRGWRAFRSSRGGRCRGASRGGIPARTAGSSVEFAEYRKYVPGDDLRRLDWRAYGRSDRFFVKEFEADTNLRCCLVRRYQRLDGVSARRASPSSNTPGGSPGRSATWRSSKATRSACRAWPAGSCATSRPAQPVAPDDRLRRSRADRAAGRDPARAGAARAGRDDPPAGADRHHLRPVRRARAAAVAASSTCGSASTTSAIFHLLDPQELGFDFRRPMRFLDMEGGPSIFAEPNEIADRYHKALCGLSRRACSRSCSNRPSIITGSRSTKITSRC